MKIINLDDMLPESATIIHKGQEYELNPLGTDDLLRIVPVWEKYAALERGDPSDPAARANLAKQLPLALDFISTILPNFPEGELHKLTAAQLRRLMDAILSTVGLTEPKEEGKTGAEAGAEGPKPDTT